MKIISLPYVGSALRKELGRMIRVNLKYQDIPAALAASTSPWGVFSMAPLMISMVYAQVFRVKAKSAQKYASLKKNP